MPDEVDDLILKMQHLEAEAHASQKARSVGDRAARLKSQSQKLAAQAQDELTAAETDQAEGEAKEQRARRPGLSPIEAADLLVAGRTQSHDAKTRVIKARARLNFALDRMDDAERQEWDAMQASAAAETHAQLAESGDDSSRAPNLSAATASSDVKSSSAAANSSNAKATSADAKTNANASSSAPVDPADQS